MISPYQYLVEQEQNSYIHPIEDISAYIVAMNIGKGVRYSFEFIEERKGEFVFEAPVHDLGEFGLVVTEAIVECRVNEKKGEAIFELLYTFDGCDMASAIIGRVTKDEDGYNFESFPEGEFTAKDSAYKGS